MQRPLPDDVARPVRAYLAALVPADERSDAWHELVDDVGYWGDRELLPVLRLAHQVVLQHERVTPEVAALALVEVGVDEPADVAAVLGTDEATAREWTRTALEARDGDTVPVGRFVDPAATATSPDRTTASPPADPRPAASDPEAEPEVEGGGSAVRIGFDDDEPLPSFSEDAGQRWTTRRILVAALVLWALVVLVWLLVT